MVDVRIQRCRLRIVRSGGWTWGADRQDLIDFATGALPGLIADALSGLPLTDRDAHIRHLAVRLQGTTDRTASPLSGTLATRDTMRISAQRQLAAQILAAAPDIVAPAPDEVRPSSRPGPTVAAASPLPLLARWRSDGSLSVRLRLFSAAALGAWLQQSVVLHRLQTAAAPINTASLYRSARSLLRVIPAYRGDVAGVLRRRLHMIAELAFHHPGKISAESLEHTLDAVLPTSQAGPTGAFATMSAATARPGPCASPRPADPSPNERTRIECPTIPTPCAPEPLTTMTDTHVASALPFLLLGTLQRVGYLDSLAATLEVSRAAELAPVFAASLALMLVPAGRRGTVLDATERNVIETFSAQTRVPSPRALDDYQRRIGDAMSAADASVYAALLHGHTDTAPLLIDRFAGGWLLFDTEGLFPVAFADSAAGMDACLGPYGPSVVLLPARAVDPHLLGSVRRAGCAFLTDASPGRQDRWQPVGGTRGIWTDRDRPATRRALRNFEACDRAALRFIDECLATRQPYQALVNSHLGVSVTLAAGLGLADLAFTLWGEHEFSHPLLALERLRDLGARVRMDAEQVRVSLALGRRYLDLRNNGLLRDVAGVPWFGDRTVVFCGL